MSKWYLVSGVPSPVVTDVGSTCNTPSGAGDFSITTIGTLSETLPGATSSSSISAPMSNGDIKGFLWVTEAGVPGLAQFPLGGWTAVLKITDLQGNAATDTVSIFARIVRLDVLNEIVAIGGISASSLGDVNNSGVDYALPLVITLDLPPTAFAAGDATDRLGLQVWVQDVGSQTSTTAFTIEIDSAASYLTNELRLYTVESFDHIAPAGYSAGATCALAGPVFCGVALTNLHGAIACGGSSGQPGWAYADYELVTGYDGVGHALEAPSNVTFFLQNTNTADTWVIGFRFKTTSVTDVQQIITVGTSGSARSVSADIDATGHVRIYTGGAAAGAGTLIATSTQTLTADTWYHIEFAVYTHLTLGNVEFRVDGVPFTWASGSLPDAILGGAQAACTWNNSFCTVDAAYVFAGNTSGYADGDFLSSSTRLPRIQTLLPVAQGSNNDYQRWSGNSNATTAFVGAGNSSNWDYVNDANNDSPCTNLRGESTDERDSWILAPLTSEAGEVIAFLTSFCLVAESDNNYGYHEVYLSGTTYRIDAYGEVDDLEFGELNVGAQWHYTCRHWLRRPDRGAWDVADFAGIEVGVYQPNNFDTMVSQARGIVLFYEPLPVTISDDVGDLCTPCADTLDAFFVDSGLFYSGRNSVDGGVTESTSTMTLSVSPAGDWTTVGGEHLLTCSTALFTGGDSFYVGKAIKLIGADDESVVCDIIDHNAGDATLDVTIRTAVPVSLQGTATATWELQIDEITLAHLEGETVAILADGIVQSRQTVVGGVVTLEDHFSVITAGLPIRAILQTLPIDPPAEPPTADLPKDVVSASVFVEATRGFELGSDEDNLDPVVCDPYAAETDLITGKVVNIPRAGHIIEDGGRVRIEQNDPLPVTILGIISNYSLGTRNGS